MARLGEGTEAAAEPRTGPSALAAGLLPQGAFSPFLTKRENEVLLRMAAGLQNRDIARDLGISLATARNHTHNILEKLEVHSRLQAVSLAFQQGWVKSARQPRRAAV